MKLRAVPKALIAALAISLALWCIDYPKPNWDDLFYMGAGMHLANGGDFSNPLLARQGFPSHFFFVYPPLQSYALAAWLKVFSISARSVTAFAMVNFAVICSAFILFLRRHGAHRLLEWLVVPAALFGLLPLGLRPEPLAVALVMCGLLLADRQRRSGLPLFIGLLLMYLAASAAPRVTFFAAALIAYSGFVSIKEPGVDRRNKGQILAVHLVAAAVTGLIFLVMIHFRLHEFWQTFHFHAQHVANKIQMLRDFAFYTLGVLQWPLVLLPLVLVAFALRRGKRDFTLIGVFVLAAVPITALAGGLGHGTLWWFIFAMFMLTASSSIDTAKIPRQILLAVMVVLIVVSDRRFAAELFGTLSGGIAADSGDQFQRAIALKNTAEQTILVDSVTARYVFDYRIPEGSFDASFASFFPGNIPGDLSTSELRAGDLFVVGPGLVSVLDTDTYLNVEVPMWYAFGLKKLGFARYPRHVYIFPTTDSKGPRPEKR